MFRTLREAHRQFLEVQAEVDARGDKLWIEYLVYFPPLGSRSSDSDFHHKVARWTARLIRWRFHCQATAVKYVQFDRKRPSVKITVSFIKPRHP